MKRVLMFGALALGIWAGAGVVGLAVRWDVVLTPALGAVWAAAVIGAILTARKDGRRVR